MCNCNNNISLCPRCSKGLTCECPPDYSILPLPVPCTCCPPGYLPAGTAPNVVCKNLAGSTVPAIPCTPCESAMPSDCVILPTISCLGVQAGTTLTTFLNYLCSEAFIAILLQKIGLDSNLGSALCQLVQNCQPAGSGSTPIISSLIVTVP